MKLSVCVSAVLLFSASLMAQPVITSSDLPSGVVTFPMVNALPVQLPNYQQGGAAQVWDFSTLSPLITENDQFIGISQTPFLYQFLFNSPFTPQYQATHAIEGEGIDLGFISIDQFFLFFKNTPTQYNLVGYGGTLSGIPVPSQTNPIDVVYALPISYNDTHSSYSEWGVTLPTFGTYEQKQTRTYTVDGYGTVITPVGTYEALRLRMQQDIEDFIQIEGFGDGFTFEREIVAYQWLVPGQGVPVIEVTETFGQPTSVRYKADSTPVGLAEASAQQGVKVYPTLCTDRLTIEGVQLGDRIELFTTSGQLVRTWNDGLNCSVSGLPAGCYLLSISTSGQHFTEKIMVQP